MAKEIELLVEAVRKGGQVVEKETGIVWSPEDLQVGLKDRLFQNEDRVAVPDGQLAVSDLYPACIQQTGRPGTASYGAVGQTEHFVIFAISPC